MLVIRKTEEEPREKRRVVDQEDRRGTERKREGGRKGVCKEQASLQGAVHSTELQRPSHLEAKMTIAMRWRLTTQKDKQAGGT